MEMKGRKRILNMEDIRLRKRMQRVKKLLKKNESNGGNVIFKKERRN